MFRSSVRSSSGSFFIYFLIDVADIKNKQHSVQLTSPRSTHYRQTKHMLPHNHDGLIIRFKLLNILIVFISNINKEINKKTS